MSVKIVSDDVWLTVTKVVFEFEYPVWVNPRYLGLTVTKVVFEYVMQLAIINIYIRLTVTKVVFE